MNDKNYISRLHNSAVRQSTHQGDVQSVAPADNPVVQVPSLLANIQTDYESFALAVGTGHGCGYACQDSQAQNDQARMIGELHEVVVKRSASRLAYLSETERELYDAADEKEPLSASNLCQRIGVDLNAGTKTSLSTLVKLGLLLKAGGRKGYLRLPTKS